MFWAKRLEQQPETDSSWMLSYGDLMSLLLALFVMIAAMSEVRADGRFARISDGVREAFGFDKAAPAFEAEALTIRQPLTLLERLERAGFSRRSHLHLIGPDDEVLAPVDVLLGDGCMRILIAGHVSFEPFSAAIDGNARKALARIAAYMAEDEWQIEIRGRAAEGPLPTDAPFRDGLDLSYARGRAVADVLAGNGIARDRLKIVACDANVSADVATVDVPTSDTDAPAATAAALAERGRRIELTVRAAAAAEHVEKSPGRKGQDG